MINWNKTEEETGFGKEYFDKYPKSNKRICCICDNPDCKNPVRWSRMADYHKLCYSCAIEKREQSPEYKAMMKEIYNSPEWQKSTKEGSQKRSQTPDWQKHVKESAQKRSALTQEHIKHIKESIQKLYNDPEFRRKQKDETQKSNRDPEKKRKFREAMRKLHNDPLFRQKHKEAMRKCNNNPLFRQKQKETMQKLNDDPDFCRKRKEILSSNDFAKRVSAGLQHVSYDEWEGFVEDTPYCPAFDETCRESNRDKYGRNCFLCGLQEKDNVTSTGKHQKLSVHHVDMNKNQGCDEHKWKLVPVCIHCHGKIHNKSWASRIMWLLDNVWSNKT